MLENLLGQFLGPMKAEVEALSREYTPDIFMKAAFAKVCQAVLNEAKKAGPPPEFAERLGMPEPAAREVYDFVLYCALTRYEPPTQIKLEVVNGG